MMLADIDFELDAKNSYPELWRLFKEAGFTELQASIAVSIAVQVCHHCYADLASNCYCMRDD